MTWVAHALRSPATRCENSVHRRESTGAAARIYTSMQHDCAQSQRFWRRSCSLPVNGMKAAHHRSAVHCKNRCNGQKGLDAARTHMSRAFDCFRHHGMVLPTQAVLPTIANRAKLPDVLVQQLIRVESAHARRCLVVGAAPGGDEDSGELALRDVCIPMMPRLHERRWRGLLE